MRAASATGWPTNPASVAVLDLVAVAVVGAGADAGADAGAFALIGD